MFIKLKKKERKINKLFNICRKVKACISDICMTTMGYVPKCFVHLLEGEKKKRIEEIRPVFVDCPFADVGMGYLFQLWMSHDFCISMALTSRLSIDFGDEYLTSRMNMFRW